MARLFAACLMALAAAGCAVFPMHVYVADERDGRLLYSNCALNRHVPDGILVERRGVEALVSLRQGGSLKYVEVRLDIPPGRTVVLGGDTIRIDRGPSGVLDARFPNVSRVDSPAINSYSSTPSLQQQQLPVETPLVGGTIRAGTSAASKKHYWLAAKVDVEAVDRLSIALPSMRIDGVDTRFPVLGFERRLIVATAVFNC